MKSDCTHRLNKGEATKGDIALSLSKVMADKVSEFLIKAKVRAGQVVLVGGVTQNRHLLRFLARGLAADRVRGARARPRYFEAFGAAHLAPALGRPLPAAQPAGLRPFQPAAGTPFAPLAVGRGARHATSPRGAARCGPRRRVHPRRRRRLDHDQGGAGRRRDPGDRRRALRAHARRPRRGAQALPGARCSEQLGDARPADHARRHDRLVARAARRLPGDRAASTTRSSPTPPARPSSSPTSTRSSRSAGRTPSTCCSTTACPSTTR